MSAAALRSPRLTTERLVLEPLCAAHADDLYELLDDPLLHEFMGGAPLAYDALRARFARLQAGASPDGAEEWLNWAVRRRQPDAFVGTLQATLRRGEAPATACLAWVLGRAHQGQGLAAEAAQAVADWLETKAGVARLEAHIHRRHLASRAVARRVGLLPTQGLTLDGEVVWARERPRPAP